MSPRKKVNFASRYTADDGTTGPTYVTGAQRLQEMMSDPRPQATHQEAPSLQWNVDQAASSSYSEDANQRRVQSRFYGESLPWETESVQAVRSEEARPYRGMNRGCYQFPVSTSDLDDLSTSLQGATIQD